jgi:2-amino-4-hydroxy-6-hydroxymethyldihydropteridine diphosphokinase
LGSNQRHSLIGRPRQIIEQAVAALECDDIDVFAQSPITRTAAIGPSLRHFANAAAILSSTLSPPDLLARLHAIELHFGRTWRGQRWRARTLDLDIVLWSGGIWVSDAPRLAIPHIAMRERGFVLGPATAVAPDWRDPLSGRTIRQLFHRLNRAKPLDRLKNRL